MNEPQESLPKKSKSWTLEKSQSATLSTDQLRTQSVTDFALFLLIEGDFVLFATPPYKWQQGELDRLAGQGHADLYYHTTDQSKVDAYLQISALPQVDPSLPPKERLLQITDVAAQLTKILYDYPLTATSLAKGSEIAIQMTDVMIEDNSCVIALGKLASHDWYTYYHSARVAAYSLALAVEMGLTDKIQLQDLSIGCLFHDVGKSKIELSILNKAGPLDTKEWGLIRSHPEFGITVIDATRLGTIPREVILHHHERMDGGGYPHRLQVNELLQEVRIASFADTFDALTTNRPYQPSRSRFEALDLIRHRFLQQLDPECFKAMVTLLQREQAA